MVRTHPQSMVITLVAVIVLWLSGCNWQGESHRDNTQDDLRVIFQIPVQQTNDPNSDIAGAGVDAAIAVAFSRQMDLCSFTAESLLVSTNGNPPVGGFIYHRPTSSYPNGFILFQPTKPLDYNSIYTVTIKAGVRAMDGTLLPVDYSWNFMTVAPPAANNFGGGLAPSISRAAPLVASPITCETPAAAIQADGKVITAGHINGTNFMEFVVARYNAGGGLDVSFSGDGITSTVIGPGNSQALAATVQADGKIVAVGVGSNATDKDFALARYLADGSFDPTFSDDGRHRVDFGTGDERAVAVAVQPADGKIIVAGSGGDGTAFILARYNVNGGADATFDANTTFDANDSVIDGIVISPATVSSEASYAMVLQSDGKIVVASKALVGATQVTVTRYNATGINAGRVDTSFNGGVVPLVLLLPAQQAAATLAAHADGRIALVQHTGVGATAQFTVLDYLVY